jgi:Fur family ferric uptake transcriptional regulator
VTRAPERPALDFSSPEDILATLRAAGHRVSAPAARVLDALFTADGPVSADHIAGTDASLERTSVYRNLERLEALGVVSHVHVGHGPGLYALARGTDREYLCCDRCGRVTTVDPAALDAVRAALHAEFGHHAKFSHFPIHGLCASCAHSHSDIGEHHEHEHSHGDLVHSHPHVHEAGIEHDHEH